LRATIYATAIQTFALINNCLSLVVMPKTPYATPSAKGTNQTIIFPQLKITDTDSQVSIIVAPQQFFRRVFLAHSAHINPPASLQEFYRPRWRRTRQTSKNHNLPSHQLFHYLRPHSITPVQLHRAYALLPAAGADGRR